MTLGNARKLRNALVQILEGVQYGGEPAFVAVQTDTSMQFEGYPTVKVLPNKQKSVVDDQANYEHTVSFVAIIHWKLQDPTVVESDLYDQMLDLTDLIQDTVEHGDTIEQLTTIDPTVAQYWMTVPDVSWTVASGAIGAFLMASIVIEFKYLKDSR